MPDRISVLAPAKINLYLHVTGKRADGFHLLDSLIAFADYGDQITVTPAKELSLSIDGPFATGLTTGGDNLVIKAAQILANFAGLEPQANIALTKNLPIASGLGGGSTDAAATLHALIALWEISPSQKELLGLAANLGADVPVCMIGAPAFVAGIGEVVTPAPLLPKTWLVLVNPGEAVSTPEVFAKRTDEFSATMRFDLPPATTTELATLLGERRNDLTAPAQAIAPIIRNTLSALNAVPGQLLSRLSGSGATCFALFENEKMAHKAAHSLRTNHPAWWIKAVALRS